MRIANELQVTITDTLVHTYLHKQVYETQRQQQQVPRPQIVVAHTICATGTRQLPGKLQLRLTTSDTYVRSMI